MAYSPLLGGPHESTGPLVLTNDGEWMPFYAAAWAMLAVASLVCVVRGSGSWPVLGFATMMGIWGGGYAVAWAVLHDASWMTAALYTGVSVHAAGAYLWLASAERAHRAVTESLRTVPSRAEGGGETGGF